MGTMMTQTLDGLPEGIAAEWVGGPAAIQSSSFVVKTRVA